MLRRRGRMDWRHGGMLRGAAPFAGSHKDSRSCQRSREITGRVMAIDRSHGAGGHRCVGGQYCVLMGIGASMHQHDECLARLNIRTLWYYWDASPWQQQLRPKPAERM